MNKGNYNIITFLAIFISFCQIYRHFPKNTRIQGGFSSENIESKLAIGEKVLLAEVGMIDLEKLPGISSVIASRIYEVRDKLSSMELDLEDIKGIGEVKKAQITKLITIERNS